MSRCTDGAEHVPGVCIACLERRAMLEPQLIDEPARVRDLNTVHEHENDGT